MTTGFLTAGFFTGGLSSGVAVAVDAGVTAGSDAVESVAISGAGAAFSGAEFLLKFGSMPVMAAMPVTLARITATAAAAVSGCIFDDFFSVSIFASIESEAQIIAK